MKMSCVTIAIPCYGQAEHLKRLIASLKGHPGEVKAFLKAVEAANRMINTDPDSVRSVMVKYVRLPGPLKAKRIARWQAVYPCRSVSRMQPMAICNSRSTV